MIITPTFTNIPSLAYRATYKTYFVAYGRTASEAINNLLNQMQAKADYAKRLLNANK